MTIRRALITGVSGQDGALLAKRLLDEGAHVVGTHRPGTSPDGSAFWRFGELGLVRHPNLSLRALDPLDANACNAIVADACPPGSYPEHWNTEGLKARVAEVLAIDVPLDQWLDEDGVDPELIEERITEIADARMAELAADAVPERLRAQAAHPQRCACALASSARTSARRPAYHNGRCGLAGARRAFSK